MATIFIERQLRTYPTPVTLNTDCTSDDRATNITITTTTTTKRKRNTATFRPRPILRSVSDETLPVLGHNRRVHNNGVKLPAVNRLQKQKGSSAVTTPKSIASSSAAAAAGAALRRAVIAGRLRHDHESSSCPELERVASDANWRMNTNVECTKHAERDTSHSRLFQSQTRRQQQNYQQCQSHLQQTSPSIRIADHADRMRNVQRLSPAAMCDVTNKQSTKQGSRKDIVLVCGPQKVRTTDVGNTIVRGTGTSNRNAVQKSYPRFVSQRRPPADCATTRTPPCRDRRQPTGHAVPKANNDGEAAAAADDDDDELEDDVFEKCETWLRDVDSAIGVCN